ncbi:MAG TPA: post-transcriptional regulator [Erysipelothrix sp.]|nr:post-transcriptional regulator [Erysipelothrix sp.]
MNQQMNLLLTLRLRQLHANNLTGITIEDLKHCMFKYKWNGKDHLRLSDLANDIFSIRDEDVVRWLATESRVSAHRTQLEDFVQQIDGSNQHE